MAKVKNTDQVRVLSLDATCPELKLVEGDGKAVAIVWPGVGAVERSMHHIALGPSARTVRQCHAGEAVYYVKSGAGTVLDPDSGSSDDIAEGSMVHVEPGTAYRFAAGAGGMELLGGPCPPDPSLYAHL